MKWKWTEHTLENNLCVHCGRVFPEAEGRPTILSNPLGWLYRGVWNKAKERCGGHDD